MLLFLLTLFVAATGVVALGYAFLTYKNRAFFGRTWFVSAEAPAEDGLEPEMAEKISKVMELSEIIHRGAMAFLYREYKWLLPFLLAVGVLLIYFIGLAAGFSFIVGGLCSAAAGYAGMIVATRTNGKTAIAATRGMNSALITAFRGGSVMGMSVVGIGVLGIVVCYAIFRDPNLITGFGMGASSIALFARVGGGIYTKAADVGADLVGKVEAGIPEDDPRNPAVIADNVGDNVGDVAGMGADLFDSNVASMSAAIIIGSAIAADAGGGINKMNVAVVLTYALIGLLASIVGVLSARMGKNKTDPTSALNKNTYVTTAVYFVLTAGATMLFPGENYKNWRIWGATMVGLLVGIIIGVATDYFTNDQRKPVRKTATASGIGPAFTILSGFSYGLISILPALIGIAVSALAAYKICEPLGGEYPMFGIAMSAVGMLSIVAMIISNDAYGPIVDNARGLVEMADLGEEALKATDKLDSAGNTVKAMTKGFAIGAAGLTVIALLGAFKSEVNAVVQGAIKGFDIMDPVVFFGLIIGAAIPAVFSAMLILGVDRNAQRMIAEIKRQFREIAGLSQGLPGAEPDYDRCIDIATRGALRELIPAGLVAIFSTLLVGFVGGVQAIGGFLTGNIVSGLLLALFMSNAGGLWDNSKKYVEDGNEGGKGSNAHKAAVIGDTVGDPFKDTAGPSINTQITVVSLVSSLMAALFLHYSII
ncbi:MAG TPA: sodium-translocating pyrophosphatase [Clostridiales bacterium]|nr:sodium-translocating pyrophosphatase [Clostridiales bacterium]